MRRLPFTAGEHHAAALAAATEVLAAHGVVLLPTETFYGLAGDPASGEAVARILAMKDRPQQMALPVLVADWQQLDRLAVVPEAHRVRLSRSWPGPLTVILPCRRPLAAAPAGTVAVRIPGHAMLRSLLYRVGPVTGTSANRHGTAPATEAELALASLLHPPQLVLDGGATPGGAPSTLVDLCGDEPQVLRQGAAAWDDFYAQFFSR